MINLKDDIQILLADELGIDGLHDSTPLFSSKLLDSMDLLRLIVLLEGRFAIKISPLDASIDMFDSINDLSILVERLS
jgi:acyl carrier protein